MLTRLISLAFVIVVLSFTTGCANRATATLTAGADLSKLKSFYIVQKADDKETQGLIKANLEKRGFTTATGPELTPPYTFDAVVTYTDKWMWDITMYMLELTINFRNPTNNFPLAVGNSMHASLTRMSPEEMVDEVLTNMFNAKP
jgi:phage-related protein